MSPGRPQRSDRGLAPHLAIEVLISSLIDHHQLLRRSPDLVTLATCGNVHTQLGAALAAARLHLDSGLSTGGDAWLTLREGVAQSGLQGCPRDIASRIRFRSHDWSNHLHALSDMQHDEDLALLAEEFCIDSRIIVAATVPGALPPDSRMLGERLLQCYQAGGWPCGWQGVFPAGGFDIYVRPTAP